MVNSCTNFGLHRASTNTWVIFRPNAPHRTARSAAAYPNHARPAQSHAVWGRSMNTRSFHCVVNRPKHDDRTYVSELRAHSARGHGRNMRHGGPQASLGLKSPTLPNRTRRCSHYSLFTRGTRIEASRVLLDGNAARLDCWDASGWRKGEIDRREPGISAPRDTHLPLSPLVREKLPL